MGQRLDMLYRVAAIISAVLIVMICMLISTQIFLNVLGRILPGVIPSTIPSYADFSGFMLAASTFLGLAYTLRSGGHIRVNLFVERLPSAFTPFFEGVALVAALGFVGIGLWFSYAMVGESLHYNDVSNGIIAIPLWVPQISMCAGLSLLFLALLHTFADLIRTRQSVLFSQGAE